MPKKLVEILQMLEEEKIKSEEFQKRTAEFRLWMKSSWEGVAEKILAALKRDLEKVFTPEELLKIIFGEEKCSLRKEENGRECDVKCGKYQKEVSPSHQFDCDFCKHAALFSGTLDFLYLEKKIAVYTCGEKVWVGAPSKTEE